MKYELVAGFETHIELSTKTKIFCSILKVRNLGFMTLLRRNILNWEASYHRFTL